MAPSDHETLISRFLENCHLKQYPAKSIIIKEGDPSYELYYIVKGSVSVLVEDAKGREIVLAYLNAGEFFGEIGLFDNDHKRTAYVRAKSKCEIAKISYERLTSLQSLFPDLLMLIASQLATRLRKTSGKVRDLAFTDVQGRVARTLLDLGRQEQALVIAQKLVRGYSRITGETRIWAWLTIADSQFENRHFHDAEISYRRALDIMPPGHDSRDAVRERYALSIYRQGEAARMAGNSDDAIAAFARVGEATTNEKIVLTADYDSAALLLGAEQWDRAAGVLESILLRQPEVTQQKDIRKKLAYAYRQSGHVEKAAEEYAWLGRYADETALRTESVREAAQLYEQIKNYRKSIENYKYMLDNFTLASGVQVGTSFHIADLYRKLSDTENVRFWLDRVIQSEKNSDDRGNITDRTLAATAALQLAQPLEARYEEISLQLPLDRSLPLKKKAMEQALAAYGRAVDYDIAEISTEAIFHIAELYHDFSRAVLASPKPRGLSDIELEQYNILLEEQAYPIEEQAITIHESNIKYLRDGIYNQWITASLRQLAELMPARYDKHEVVENVIEAIN